MLIDLGSDDIDAIKHAVDLIDMSGVAERNDATGELAKAVLETLVALSHRIDAEVEAREDNKDDIDE
jgi:hypothetical protein